MEKAGDFLKRAFSQSVDGEVTRYLPLFRNWKSIIGADLEKHIRLQDIRNDVLLVETAHPGWKQTILLRKTAILDRINSLYPGLLIKDIRVHIAKKAGPRTPDSLDPDRRVPDEDRKEDSGADMEELFSRMTDNDLKKALKKLYTARPRRRSGSSSGKNE